MALFHKSVILIAQDIVETLDFVKRGFLSFFSLHVRIQIECFCFFLSFEVESFLSTKFCSQRLST